ncbi:MAG: hypothetical protein ACYDH6_15090 [Acidimicrobiales bacterium]
MRELRLFLVGHPCDASADDDDINDGGRDDGGPDHEYDPAGARRIDTDRGPARDSATCDRATRDRSTRDVAAAHVTTPDVTAGDLAARDDAPGWLRLLGASPASPWRWSSPRAPHPPG